MLLLDVRSVESTEHGVLGWRQLMDESRRDIFRTVGIAALISVCGQDVIGAPEPPDNTLIQPFDSETYKFWTSVVRTPSQHFGKPVRAGHVLKPEFVFFDQKLGFQRSSNIDDSQFPKNGNVDITLQVLGFRPSHASAAAFLDAQSGSLRIDLKQTVPLPSLQEALAWTAMAAFVPKSASQLPDLKSLSFDPGKTWGQLYKIPLTNGLGFWSWNFFVKKPKGFWGNFIEIFRKADQFVFPLLSLPGIATTALSSIDQMLGYIQATGSSSWIFQSQDMPVYATLEGKSQTASGLPLRTGLYVIIPDDAQQISAFGDASKELEIQNGYLVRKGTDPFKWELNAALQIPMVDYLIVHVKVASALSNA